MKLTLCSIVLALTAMTPVAHAAMTDYSCAPNHKTMKNGGDAVSTLNLHTDDGVNFIGDAEGKNSSNDPEVIEINDPGQVGEDGKTLCNGAKVKINLKTGEGSKLVQYWEPTLGFGERCTSDWLPTSFTGCKAVK